MTKQIRDRDTGHVDVVENDRATWMTRPCPDMRILSDELADAVKAKLNRGVVATSDSSRSSPIRGRSGKS